MGKRRDDDDDDDCEDHDEEESKQERKLNVRKKKFIVRKPKLCDSQKEFFDKLDSSQKGEKSAICEDSCKPKDPCVLKPRSPPKPQIEPCTPKEPCKLSGPTKPTIIKPIPKPSKPAKDVVKDMGITEAKINAASKRIFDMQMSLREMKKKPGSEAPAGLFQKLMAIIKPVPKPSQPATGASKVMGISEEKINAASKRIFDMQMSLREMKKKPGSEASGGLFQKLMAFAAKFMPKPKDSSKPLEGTCKPKPKKPDTVKAKDICIKPEITCKKPEPPQSDCKAQDPCKPKDSCKKPPPKRDPCKPPDSCKPKDPCKPAKDPCKDKKPSPCEDKKPSSKLKFLSSSQKMIDAASQAIAEKHKKYKEMDMKPDTKSAGPLQKLMSCAQKCLSFESLKKLTFKDIVNKASDAMSGKGAGSGRPMKYPYTFSAKFAQFPIRFYAKNQWIWKYYFVSVAVCLPIFYSINNLANSPGNVAQWAEIRRKEALEHHH